MKDTSVDIASTRALLLSGDKGKEPQDKRPRRV